ncbi:hypothetical protein AB0H36_27505 [Kribbella sp. NPDC050820]|uniref:hypothetical protein n=1 Tax=Kribbella sp. NPDC050820 TaxID=3155408 RepID=UPI0033DDD789
MIELAAPEPCWIIQTSNPHLDEIHHRTRAAAEADVARDPRRFVDPIYVQLPRCCYLARCDDCGEPEGYAECDGGFHFPDVNPETVLTKMHDLSVAADGTLLCEDCRDRAARWRRNTAEIDVRRELQVHATALRLPGL